MPTSPTHTINSSSTSIADAAAITSKTLPFSCFLPAAFDYISSQPFIMMISDMEKMMFAYTYVAVK